MSRSFLQRNRTWIILIAIGLTMAGGFATRDRWEPSVRALVDNIQATSAEAPSEDAHAGHGANDSENSIKFTKQARANIQLAMTKVKLREVFDKTISVPGMVVEIPGQSQIDVTTPFTGKVQKIYHTQGKAVEPGHPLFDLSLTHEDLVSAQKEFLHSSGQLDVARGKLARLENVAQGVVATNRILEQRDKVKELERMLHAQRQGLITHGLAEGQVDGILSSRTLLSRMTVLVPEDHLDCGKDGREQQFHLQKLNVKRGQQVEAGHNLCVLAHHCILRVEGTAFEKDVQHLSDVAQNGWKVSVEFRTGSQEGDEVKDLQILYVADQVDPESRAFRFYITLPNGLREPANTSNREYLNWKYKPGQRVQIVIPVERWKDRIVLPVEAIVNEGAESYVFSPNGDKFERLPVHVEYRGRKEVVIANDGSIFLGDQVVTSGAYQIHMAIKTRSGGAIDPHAGHSH